MKIKTDALDKLFSEFIRKRAIEFAGGCEYCGRQVVDKVKADGSTLPAWRQLETSHFHSRRKQSVRFDPDNACGLCFSCHQHLGGNPFEHTEFFRHRLGYERLDQLNIRANTPAKIDREAIKENLKEKIELPGVNCEAGLH